MMHRVQRFLVALTAILVVGVAPIAAAGGQSGRSTEVGSKPAWAQPAARTAARSTSEQLQFRVYLHGVNEAGAEAAALAASTPGSATYRHWLTPQQVTDAYGPTRATADTVSRWLTDSGFSIVDIPANRMYVEVTGTVAQAQRAFAVQLGTYAVGSRRLRAPDRDLSLPSNVASLVSGVLGLDQAQQLPRPAVVSPQQDGGAPASPSRQSASQAASGPQVVPPPDGFRNAPPCSAFWAQKLDTTDPAYGGGFPSPSPYAPCGYKPGQLRSAYGMDKAVDHGITGEGTTVAIIDAFASPTLFADAQQYAQRNDPSHPLTSGQFSMLTFKTNKAQEPPDKCDAAGWYGEQTLDVEAVHAIAPGADILYVGASDCQDTSLDKALNAVVSGHLAQIVSNSYGDAGEKVAPQEVDAFHKIVVNAALEGIGVYFSSGDDGDEVSTLGASAADFPATDTFVTAVGGTSLGVAANGKAVVETGWETGTSTLSNGRWSPAAPGDFLYGSGGGTSRIYDEPSYQVGVVPNELASQHHKNHTFGRVVPDISMDGDPNTGMLIGETQTFPDGVYYDQYRIGGTSLSCPLFAGVMALADSELGSAHGFINPKLYSSLAGTAAVKDVLHVNMAETRVNFLNGVDATDGTSTLTRSFDYLGLTIATTPGYDNTTGTGTPNGLTFLNAI
jgi:subtilase family serine protease